MPDPALPELERRLQLASEEPVDERVRVDAMTALAWALRSEDGDRAHALAKEAREISKRIRYPRGQGWAARTMVMTFQNEDGLNTIFPLAEEAKRCFDQTDDDVGRAGARDFLATLHEHVGDLAGGLDLALDALSIGQRIGDPARQGYALSNVGGILASCGEVDAAVERLEEALALFEGIDDQRGIATITNRLAEVLRDAERDEAALVYAARCAELGERMGDEYMCWIAYDVRGVVADRRGEVGDAEAFYRQALASFDEGPARDVITSQTRISLGRLLGRCGRIEEAEELLCETLRRIEGHHVMVVAQIAVHEALAELYEGLDRLPETVKHLRSAHRLRQEVTERDARNKLTQVEVRQAMDRAREEAELQRLRFVELHAMQSKLVEAEKMALLGKLAAGTAHELNTPLGVLRSNNELAAKATRRLLGLLGDDAPGAEKLAAVLERNRESSGEAIERIAAINESFKRFTQLDQAEYRSYDVREGLASALFLLEPTLPEGVVLERAFEDVPPIRSWPREVNHAFMTVLQNGVQAIDGAGKVSASTRVEGEHVVVEIRDTGCGMCEEEVKNLFDVAWSAGGQRASMRLGLSAAYTTMQRHGGRIDVESSPGQGTMVRFVFPA